MLPPHPAQEDQGERASRLFQQAMQRDVDSQREIIAARLQGETDAVFWSEDEASAYRREQHRRFLDESEQAVVRLEIAVLSRRQIARSNARNGLSG